MISAANTCSRGTASLPMGLNQGYVINRASEIALKSGHTKGSIAEAKMVRINNYFYLLLH